ncbi:MAG: cob(I)alamin adenosyltransferase [Clostridia bacterium]|jgi:cob(I)alamin adenosyltransferase|nr:cob(I)alamin adenosyltransferase [Clostridia bacterium]MDN5323475.1 cob(I)alamin adenosyltransferase [Clostridia bacterium]
MSFEKGYVQVYTGNGKGKTTAAIGLAIRALGAGKRVLFLQFMKAKSYSEHKILPNISQNLTLETLGKPFFVARKEDLDPATLAKWQDKCVIFEPGNPPQEYIKLMKKGIVMAQKAVTNGEYDLVILDEINVAMFFELINIEDVVEIIENKAAHVELVLTGRNCPEKILDKANLVTEMREIKHYYQEGVEARMGIEN